MLSVKITAQTIEAVAIKKPEEVEKKLNTSSVASPSKKLRQRLDDINSSAIAIDTYDDIFDDFEPIDYTKMELSDDFVDAVIKRHVRSYKGNIEVKIMVPKKIHNIETENIIHSRLKDYFELRAKESAHEINNIYRQGVAFVGIGGASLITTLVVKGLHFIPGIPGDIITEFTHLAGWMFCWEGFFHKLLDIPKELKTVNRENQQLAKATFKFIVVE